MTQPTDEQLSDGTITTARCHSATPPGTSFPAQISLLFDSSIRSCALIKRNSRKNTTFVSKFQSVVFFMRPMIKYRGGKSKEIQHFLEHMPKYRGRYIEPFLGGGALFFHLEPHESIINDINAQLIGFYRGVADNFLEVHDKLHQLEAEYVANRAEFDRLKALTPDQRVEDHNEDLYYRIRDMFNGIIPSDYEPATL